MNDRLRVTVKDARTVHRASEPSETCRVHRAQDPAHDPAQEPAQELAQELARQRTRRVRRNHQRNESGFTLIELLIVIVILGVLSGIVVFAVSGIQDRGNSAACKTDKKTVLVAVEAYYAKKGSYPDAGEAGWLQLTVGLDQLLRDRPAGTGYTITLGAGGIVTATGACT